MPTYSLKGSCAAPSARRHRMKELTLLRFSTRHSNARVTWTHPSACVSNLRRLRSHRKPGFCRSGDRLSRGSISMAPAPRLRCRRSDATVHAARRSRHLVTLEQLLAKGPWRCLPPRHWCPYCRLNTNALAQAQRDVEPIGGQIVAITPDLQHFATALKSEAAAKPFRS